MSILLAIDVSGSCKNIKLRTKAMETLRNLNRVSTVDVVLFDSELVKFISSAHAKENEVAYALLSRYGGGGTLLEPVCEMMGLASYHNCYVVTDSCLNVPSDLKDTIRLVIVD